MLPHLFLLHHLRYRFPAQWMGLGKMDPWLKMERDDPFVAYRTTYGVQVDSYVVNRDLVSRHDHASKLLW